MNFLGNDFYRVGPEAPMSDKTEMVTEYKYTHDTHTQVTIFNLHYVIRFHKLKTKRTRQNQSTLRLINLA